MGMRQCTLTYNSTLGLFWNDRYKPLIESLINLVASIILLKQLGIEGVFIGTLISTIATSFWVEPYILFKHGFGIKLSLYFGNYIKYVCITITAALVTGEICSLITAYSFISNMERLLICIVVINTIFFTCTFSTEEFMEFKRMLLLGKKNS